MEILAMLILVSVIMKKQSNFISSLLASQKRLEEKIQKALYMATLVMRITYSVTIKKQSNFISSLLVS